MANVRDTLGGISGAARLATAKVLGVQVSYTHEPGKAGAAAVSLWVREVDNTVAAKIFPQLGLTDQEIEVVNIPTQTAFSFKPKTGDTCVWSGVTYQVLFEGTALPNGAGYSVAVATERIEVLGI